MLLSTYDTCVGTIPYMSRQLMPMVTNTYMFSSSYHRLVALPVEVTHSGELGSCRISVLCYVWCNRRPYHRSRFQYQLRGREVAVTLVRNSLKDVNYRTPSVEYGGTVSQGDPKASDTLGEFRRRQEGVVQATYHRNYPIYIELRAEC